MKIEPESLILDEGLCFKYKSFFISGNDESYIFAIVDLLVASFCGNGFLKKKLVNEESVVVDLFQVENKYVYVCEKYIGNNSVEEIEKNEDIFIFCEKTLTKNKSTKQFFLKSKYRALVDCYELNEVVKKNIFNGFVKKHSLVFENSNYWFLLGLLSNSFAILKKELERILLLKDKNDKTKLAEALGVGHKINADRFFFKIHLSRSEIGSFLNSSINSLSDFYSYFIYFKIYSYLLLSSKNKKELENNFPRYLFRERGGFLSLFERLNNNKKKQLSLLVYKTETLVRKRPDLYRPLFFRFILNYKKIIS